MIIQFNYEVTLGDDSRAVNIIVKQVPPEGGVGCTIKVWQLSDELKRVYLLQSKVLTYH